MISTICTNAAMMRMNAMVCRNSSPNGRRMYWLTSHVTKVESVSTKMTAAPIPNAVDVFFEVPKKGQDVLFDITIEGSLALNRMFDKDTATIFILPPSMEALENRLRGRGTETEEKIQKRLAQAKAEIKRAGEFEYIVTNDDLERAARDILAIITAEKLKASKNISTAKELE